MSASAMTARHPARLQVDYADAPASTLLAEPDTLAVFGFGDDAPVDDDPRYLRVRLHTHGPTPLEVWRTAGPVARGRDGDIAWAEDGTLQFASLELDEAAFDARGGDPLGGVAQYAYERLLAFTAARGYPHLLRIWNYLDGITEGEGDAERYKRFCLGRGLGLARIGDTALPAATAIGRVGDGPRTLQVYWLASRVPGVPLENPRQLSAYRYPRQYGPQPPSFARAMLPPDDAMPLLLSGTASIVGHESLHAECVVAQVDETLANFESLLGAARARRPSLPAAFGPRTRLKVYVRDRDELELVDRTLEARLGPQVPRIVLHAAVCRRELRVEIDGVHA